MAPDFIYEQTDIPPGMSCDEYRRLLAQRSPSHRGLGVLRRLRSARVGDRRVTHA